MSGQFVRILSVATFILSLNSCLSQNPESDKLATYFYQKCLNVTKEGKYFDKIYYESGKLSEQLTHALQKLPGSKERFCREDRPSLVKNLAIITSDLKNCFLTKEKYLSDFIKDSFSEFLHFLCHNDGETIDKFFRASSSKCRSNLENNNSDDIAKCFGKIFKPTAGYLSKSDMCDDLTTARKCFDVILDEKCSPTHPFKELNAQMFQYVSKPCSSCVHFCSFVLVLASLLLSYISR